MALKPKIKTGQGIFAPPPPFRLDKEGNVSPSIIISMNQVLAAIVKHMNNGLSFGSGINGEQPGGFDVQTIAFTSGTANTEITLPHGLGRTPFGFFTVFVDKGGVIYASRAGSWNRSRLFVMVSAADVNCIIILL